MAAVITANANWMTVLAHHTTSEAVSNGVWYEVLRTHFPYPKFIIAPEQRNQAGTRPDLTVFEIDANVNWRPIFTFEGKAPNHAGMLEMDKAIGQAKNYLVGLKSANQANGRTFGMVACGKSLALMVYNGGSGASVTQWTRGDVNLGAYNPPNGWGIWNIETKAQDIDGFLAAFAAMF